MRVALIAFNEQLDSVILTDENGKFAFPSATVSYPYDGDECLRKLVHSLFGISADVNFELVRHDWIMSKVSGIKNTSIYATVLPRSIKGYTTIWCPIGDIKDAELLFYISESIQLMKCHEERKVQIE